MAHYTAQPFSFKLPHALVKFDNLTEWHNSLSSAARSTLRISLRDTGFYGGTQEPDLLRVMQSGKADVAAQAEAQSKLIEAQLAATVRRERVSSPFGRVNPAAYLSSDPMPCRRRVKVITRHAPVSVVVSLSSFWETSVPQLVNRGVAIAAMIKRVSLTRPVDLWLCRASQLPQAGLVTLVRMSTRPLSMHVLAAVLSDQAVCRGLGFATLYDIPKHFKACRMTAPKGSYVGNGAIGPINGERYSQERNCPFAADLSKALGQDVHYIPGAYPGVADYDKVKRDPVGWVNDTVKLICGPH